MSRRAWPSELRFSKAKQRLQISFDDGETFDLPYPFLRRESPSAEVRGHGAGPKPPPPVVAEDISIEKAEPVGRYAVRLFFSDGHSSGLYTWAYLRELSEQYRAPD
ncbi:MAG: DUF971 domain-containing protein [Henriciella sp.]|nr:DUF971 domain-containing protein [Henriciella sp.]